MEIYRLSPIGEQLKHNTRIPNDPIKRVRWNVIYYISKRGQVTSEQIINGVPGSTQYTLGYLRRRGIIISTEGVGV